MKISALHNFLGIAFKSRSVGLLRICCLVYLVLLGSCKKDKDDSPPAPVKIEIAEGTLEADTGKAMWKAKTTSALIKEGRIFITSIDEEGNTLYIELLGDSIGEYIITTATGSLATYTERGRDEVFNTNTIQDSISIVNVTAIDTNYLLLSGSFNLFMKDSSGRTKNFKAGKFYKVPFTYTSTENSENMQGTINGKQFKAFATGNKNYFNEGAILIVGVSLDTLTVTLNIKKSDQPGTYYFPGDGLAAVTKGKKYYSTGRGTVVISEVDETAKTFAGTFEFVAINKNDSYDSLVIEKGSFSEVPFP